MMEFIKFLQKRPSDNNIRLSRILFGLIYISVLYYNFFIQEDANTIQSVIFGQTLNANAAMIITYASIALGIIPVFLGFSNLCIARKKIVRITQIILSVLLFFVSSIIVESANLDVDTMVFLFAFFPLVAGITGKCVTSKCLKYGEKITKIRV